MPPNTYTLHKTGSVGVCICSFVYVCVCVSERDDMDAMCVMLKWVKRKIEREGHKRRCNIIQLDVAVNVK